MKKLLYILIFIGKVMAVISQSADRNYVQTLSPLVATGEGINPDESRSLVTVQYLDGLGRVQETVEKGVTPSHSDLVSYDRYNQRGLPSEKWLPVPVSGNAGSYIDPVAFCDRAQNFYQDARPFSETRYELSLLNREIETIGPGEAWYKSQDYESYSSRTQYLVNGAEGELAVPVYYRNARVFTRKGYYPPGSLQVTQSIDENGNKNYEFTDIHNRVVLQRAVDGGNFFDTYYLYNRTGRLQYVLTPQAIHLFSADGNYTEAQLLPYMYTYNYDDYGRCTTKRFPGADTRKFVYDKTGQLILRREPTTGWLFTIPDKQGRVVLTGQCSFSLLPPDLSELRIYTEWADGESGFEGTGYRKPFNINMKTAEVHQVYYYDHYGFRNLAGFASSEFNYAMPPELADTRYGEDTDPVGHTGLLTGISNRVLETNDFLRQVFYYDGKGRNIQTVSENYIGGIDRESVEYNFTGQPVKKICLRNGSSDTPITEYYTFTYDHAGRLTQVRHRLNDLPVRLLLTQTYDELGRVDRKHQGNLSYTAYSYNIRGWMTKIDNPSYYTQTNYYHTVPQKSHPVYYNGNLSWITYTGRHKDAAGNGVVHQRDMRLKYDGLDRLTLCDQLDSRPDYDLNYESYQYDKNGNITLLTRGYKNYIVDELHCTYKGNQLGSVTDAGYDVYLSEIPQINAGTYDGAFRYDKNGNLIQDATRGIDTVRYNVLNLPGRVVFSQDGRKSEYIYLADGTKLKARYITPVKGVVIPEGGIKDALVTSEEKPVAESGLALCTETNYVGNCIYKGKVLDKILFDGGYIQRTMNQGQPEYKYYYYIQDHLGSNRVIVREDGTVVQAADYLPSGIATTEYDGLTADNHLHTGKEFDSMHGLHWYDNGARWLDPIFHRFTTMDPLAEQYYAISPYAVCANNPLKYVDPTGMYFDEDNEKVAKEIEDEIERKIKKLLKQMSKIIKEGGDIGDRQARIAELRQSRIDIGDMRKNVMIEFKYLGVTSDKAKKLSLEGPTTLNMGNNSEGNQVITMFTENKMGSKIHESRHGGDIARGLLDESNYSIQHEVRAYRAQYSFDGFLQYIPYINYDKDPETLLKLYNEGVKGFMMKENNIKNITPEIIRTMVDNPGLMQKKIYNF